MLKLAGKRLFEKSKGTRREVTRERMHVNSVDSFGAWVSYTARNSTSVLEIPFKIYFRDKNDL